LGIKAGIIAMRSVRCSSWSLRISVRARKARFMGVFGSLELNNAALSLTYLVSAALVRKVRPTDLTRNTGVSRLKRL
jgi:hypothetical protein